MSRYKLLPYLSLDPVNAPCSALDSVIVLIFSFLSPVFQVYTVGPDYAHAEARKSPALDGKVERDSEGKEVRYPVMLTAMEKLVARKVCLAFKVTFLSIIMIRKKKSSGF